VILLYETDQEHSYVMRDIAFPIDIIFIDEEGQITVIHHAELEDSEPLTEYKGWSKYGIEVPHHWTTENDINVGDTVKFQWGHTRTETGRISKVSSGDNLPNDVATNLKRRPTTSSP